MTLSLLAQAIFFATSTVAFKTAGGDVLSAQFKNTGALVMGVGVLIALPSFRRLFKSLGAPRALGVNELCGSLALTSALIAVAVWASPRHANLWCYSFGATMATLLLPLSFKLFVRLFASPITAMGAQNATGLACFALGELLGVALWAHDPALTAHVTVALALLGALGFAWVGCTFTPSAVPTPLPLPQHNSCPDQFGSSALGAACSAYLVALAVRFAKDTSAYSLALQSGLPVSWAGVYGWLEYGAGFGLCVLFTLKPALVQVLVVRLGGYRRAILLNLYGVGVLLLLAASLPALPLMFAAKVGEGLLQEVIERSAEYVIETCLLGRSRELFAFGLISAGYRLLQVPGRLPNQLGWSATHGYWGLGFALCVVTGLLSVRRVSRFVGRVYLHIAGPRA